MFDDTRGQIASRSARVPGTAGPMAPKRKAGPLDTLPPICAGAVVTSIAAWPAPGVSWGLGHDIVKGRGSMMRMVMRMRMRNDDDEDEDDD